MCCYSDTPAAEAAYPRAAHPCTVQYLQPLINAENATLPLELLASEKKAADKNKGRYQQLVSAIKSSHSGASVACLVKAQLSAMRCAFRA